MPIQSGGKNLAIFWCIIETPNTFSDNFSCLDQMCNRSLDRLIIEFYWYFFFTACLRMLNSSASEECEWNTMKFSSKNVHEHPKTTSLSSQLSSAATHFRLSNVFLFCSTKNSQRERLKSNAKRRRMSSFSRKELFDQIEFQNFFFIVSSPRRESKNCFLIQKLELELFTLRHKKIDKTTMGINFYPKVSIFCLFSLRPRIILNVE